MTSCVCVCALLLSQLLDEDGNSRRLGSYFLDEGVVVLPLRFQTHLKEHAESALTYYAFERRRARLWTSGAGSGRDPGPDLLDQVLQTPRHVFDEVTSLQDACVLNDVTLKKRACSTLTSFG